MPSGYRNSTLQCPAGSRPWLPAQGCGPSLSLSRTKPRGGCPALPLAKSPPQLQQLAVMLFEFRTRAELNVLVLASRQPERPGSFNSQVSMGSYTLILCGIPRQSTGLCRPVLVGLAEWIPLGPSVGPSSSELLVWAPLWHLLLELFSSYAVLSPTPVNIIICHRGYFLMVKYIQEHLPS